MAGGVELLVGEVNEDSTAYLTASFKDADGNLEVPTQIEYRIDDDTAKTQILDWTTVSPLSTVQITITPAQNAILDSTQAYEDKEVTIRAQYGGGSDQVVSAMTYRVHNLEFQT